MPHPPSRVETSSVNASNTVPIPASLAAIGSRQKKSLTWTWALFIAFVVGVVTVSFITNGKIGVEKSLTRMTFPAGILWLGMIWLTLHALLQQRVAAAGGLFIMSATYTLVGSGLGADAIQHYLEGQYQEYIAGVDADIDLLVVLGGGTTQGPTRAQAGSSGDRVLYAAQLFLQGHVKKLITTGDSLQSLSGRQTSPQEHTVEIWQQLNIPADVVETLPGRNTYEEIQSLKGVIDQYAGKRVGLLTSAAHIPRAMRLARAAEMDNLIAIPCDYRARQGKFTFMDLIPQGESLARFASCQHELLAGLVGR